MTEPLKFFKIDDSTIYQDGFTYSFHRDLDPSKSSADLQLQQSFHCTFKEEENCQSRCHVTGNWEMDKKGRKFMLGIVKKGDHTHGQEYRDTTPKLKFYKNDDESVHRNGFDYTFYRELDPPKQIGDFQWHRTYRCALSDQENCRARIYTTGQWEVNKREFQYQLGIFKNCFHSHESDQVSKEEDKKNNSVKKITASTSSIRMKDLDKKEQIRFYKYKLTAVQHDGFVYNYHKDMKCHPLWKHRMYCQRQINGKRTCTGYIWTTGKWDEDDRGREYQIGIVMAQHDHEPYQISKEVEKIATSSSFCSHPSPHIENHAAEQETRLYKYKETMIQHNGFVYCFHSEIKSHPKWKHRMFCQRLSKGKKTCKGFIRTTGEWECDERGREYQIGIVMAKHDHEPLEISFQGKDNDDEARDPGLKFFCMENKLKRKMVYRDRFAYVLDNKLKSQAPWKQRMKCNRRWEKFPCKGSIWTTGTWEKDQLGRDYQRGILRAGHSHKPYKQFLNEDDTTNVGIAESMEIVN
ncbi:hypothetical protein Ddc_17820 [Ditylenchus destructor]|nr:hypothetical protein Ddc_17820 [Ditylenchus destructor]